MGPPPGHSPVTAGPGPSAVPLAPAPPQQMAMDDANSNDGRKAKRELSQSKRAAQNRAAQVSLSCSCCQLRFFLCIFFVHVSQNGLVRLFAVAGQYRVCQQTDRAGIARILSQHLRQAIVPCHLLLV